MRILVLAPVLLLAACSEEATCNLIGEYSGQYTGDAEGNIELAILDEDGETVVNITLEDTDLTVEGTGTINCEDGSFVTDLTVDGEQIGTLEGAVTEEGVGEGTWEFTDGQLSGKSGAWSVE
jgi:hypothetical protein